MQMTSFAADELFKKSELIPVVVQNIEDKNVLMVGYANKRAVELTVKTGTAWFYSRSRSSMWNKGESSGNFLEVYEIIADCDLDTLIYMSKPAGPTCHTGESSCFFNSFWRR